MAATQGVRLVSLDAGDVLVDVARLVPEDESPAPVDGGESGDGSPADPDELTPAGGVQDNAPDLAESSGDYTDTEPEA